MNRNEKTTVVFFAMFSTRARFILMDEIYPSKYVQLATLNGTYFPARTNGNRCKPPNCNPQFT